MIIKLTTHFHSIFILNNIKRYITVKILYGIVVSNGKNFFLVKNLKYCFMNFESCFLKSAFRLKAIFLKKVGSPTFD